MRLVQQIFFIRQIVQDVDIRSFKCPLVGWVSRHLEGDPWQITIVQIYLRINFHVDHVTVTVVSWNSYRRSVAVFTSSLGYVCAYVVFIIVRNGSQTFFSVHDCCWSLIRVMLFWCEYNIPFIFHSSMMSQ